MSAGWGRFQDEEAGPDWLAAAGEDAAETRRRVGPRPPSRVPTPEPKSERARRAMGRRPRRTVPRRARMGAAAEPGADAAPSGWGSLAERPEQSERGGPKRSGQQRKSRAASATIGVTTGAAALPPRHRRRRGERRQEDLRRLVVAPQGPGSGRRRQAQAAALAREAGAAREEHPDVPPRPADADPLAVGRPAAQEGDPGRHRRGGARSVRGAAPAQRHRLRRRSSSAPGTPSAGWPSGPWATSCASAGSTTRPPPRRCPRSTRTRRPPPRGDLSTPGCARPGVWIRRCALGGWSGCSRARATPPRSLSGW